MDWAEKYRPRHLAEFVGNREALHQMSEWARDWKPGTPPLILYGKPGIGKTSSAWALGSDMNWEVVELNASDQRTKAVIEKVAGGSASTGSLTGAERKLIILDEADNLQGNADRGGAKAIVEVIKQAMQPVILIANDLYGLDGSIRNICTKVQFRALQSRSLVPWLREICSHEGVSCSTQALTEIAEQAGGDIRSAVTMLYASAIGRESVSDDDVSISGKDSRGTIFDLVSATLGFRQNQNLLELNMTVDETPDTVMQWVEGNLSIISSQSAIAGAYGALSRADLYLGNTYRNQYYTLWRYANALMLLGVHAHMQGRQEGYTKIMPPTRWRQMSVGKRQKTVRGKLLVTLGSATHMSASSVRNLYLCPFSLLAQKFPFRFAEDFHLEEDQLDFLIQNPTVSKAVIKEILEEKKRIEKEEKKKKKDIEAALKKEKTKKTQAPPLPPLTDNVLPELRDTEQHGKPDFSDEKKSDKSEKEKKSSQSTLFSF